MLTKGKLEKIFLSETTRRITVIFGIKHHLVDLFEICSNNAPGAKVGSAMGSHVLHIFIQGRHKDIFLSEHTGLET